MMKNASGLADNPHGQMPTASTEGVAEYAYPPSLLAVRLVCPRRRAFRTRGSARLPMRLGRRRRGPIRSARSEATLASLASLARLPDPVWREEALASTTWREGALVVFPRRLPPATHPRCRTHTGHHLPTSSLAQTAQGRLEKPRSWPVYFSSLPQASPVRPVMQETIRPPPLLSPLPPPHTHTIPWGLYNLCPPPSSSYIQLRPGGTTQSTSVQ